VYEHSKEREKTKGMRSVRSETRRGEKTNWGGGDKEKRKKMNKKKERKKKEDRRKERMEESKQSNMVYARLSLQLTV
jgi:hypothetical protein